MKNKKQKVSVTTSIALLIVSIIVIAFAFKQQTDIKNQDKKNTQEIKKEIQQVINDNLIKPSSYPDYESLSQLNKATLVSNFLSWTPSSTVTQDKLKKVLILNKGELAKTYVYIKASLDEKALTQWESIYLTMNWVGGHLFRPLSLPIPPSTKTELLYAINYVPYLSDIPYNEQSKPFTANWFPYFIEGNTVEVDTFISSLRPALLEELTIYYQCVKNSDCLLTVR